MDTKSESQTESQAVRTNGMLLIGSMIATFTLLHLKLALIAFGIGLGMALDEWVYLIATDGTNASYLLPVSFWGGVIVVALACLYAYGLTRLKAK